MYGKIRLSLLAGLFTVFPALAADDHGTVAFPIERLQLDWMRQDAGRLDVSACFVRTDSCELERQMVRKVLDEVKSRKAPPATVEACARELASLVESNTPGANPAWRRLYFQLCETRRKLRLQIVSRFAERYIYAKHCQLSNQPSFASTAFLSDSVYKDRLGDWKMGSELCLLTVAADGQVTSETLLRQPEGIIRDPCISFAGTQIAFSMRTSEHTDDYHLYVLQWPDRSVQQITFGPGTADVEPCWLPEGDIIFASTRCDISVPCWSSDATNLYRCDGQGRYLRRLGYDQAHTLYPQLLHDGRIVYTRWEYNDRVSGKVHKLFVMNPDGTAQIEFYGNNSHSPRSIIHARPPNAKQCFTALPAGAWAFVLKQGHRFARLAERYRDAMLGGTADRGDGDAVALALLQRICLFRLGVDAETLVGRDLVAVHQVVAEATADVVAAGTADDPVIAQIAEDRVVAVAVVEFRRKAVSVDYNTSYIPGTIECCAAVKQRFGF